MYYCISDGSGCPPMIRMCHVHGVIGLGATWRWILVIFLKNEGTAEFQKSIKYGKNNIEFFFFFLKKSSLKLCSPGRTLAKISRMGHFMGGRMCCDIPTLKKLASVMIFSSYTFFIKLNGDEDDNLID